MRLAGSSAASRFCSLGLILPNFVPTIAIRWNGGNFRSGNVGLGLQKDSLRAHMILACATALMQSDEKFSVRNMRPKGAPR